MIELEEFIYNITLPADYYEAVVEPVLLGKPQTVPVGRNMTIRDACNLYNRTGDEDYFESVEDKCNKDKPYDCPVPDRERCFISA